MYDVKINLGPGSMEYNVYKLCRSMEFNMVNEPALPEALDDRLNVIENEVVLEYKKKQHSRPGIRSLGKEIRLNPTIVKVLSLQAGGSVIIKMTENRRSFLKIFVDALKEYQNCNIYFLILEDEFGKKSNLVDSSFVRMRNIKEDIECLTHSFTMKEKVGEIYFIEWSGFSEHYITTFEEYATIKDKNNG